MQMKDTQIAHPINEYLSLKRDTFTSLMQFSLAIQIKVGGVVALFSFCTICILLSGGR